MSPPVRRLPWIVAIVAALVFISLGTAFHAATQGQARPSVASGTGRNPNIPPPDTSLLPVIEVAPATGWRAEESPIAGDGMGVECFASNLDHPRWIHVLPNGDVLVAETND